MGQRLGPIGFIAAIIVLFAGGIGITAGLINVLGQYSESYFRAASRRQITGRGNAPSEVEPSHEPPAFQVKELVTTEAMTLDDVLPWITDLVTEHPSELRLNQLGYTASGREIIALESTPESPAKRMVVLCRQHGDEPETTLIGLKLLARYLSDSSPEGQTIRARVALTVIPVANPDGAARLTRCNSLNQDLNRDWITARTAEVAALRGLILQQRPDLVVDVHQWVPGDGVQMPMAESAGSRIAEGYSALMSRAAQRAGFRLADHETHQVDSLAHRYLTSQGIPAILVETVHIPGSKAQRHRAVGTSLAALQATLKRLADG